MSRLAFHRWAWILTLVAFACGCASQQTIRVVDSVSGEPLRDVRVERLDGSYRLSPMPFVVLNELTPAEKQATSESGAVKFEKGSKFMVNPSDADPLYNHAYVTTTWSGAKICYPKECREISVSRKNGVVEVPLQRRGPGGKVSGSETASSTTSHDKKEVIEASHLEGESDVGDSHAHE